MDPLISVIMTVYNERFEWIEESIQSILNQTYPNIEFIIICDSEDENIINFLKKIGLEFSQIKIYYNSSNLGLVKSLNLGISLASGEYIARMDADDISMLNRLEQEITYMNNNKADLVFSSVNLMNEDGKVQYTVEKRNYDNNQLKELFKYGNISKHPTWLGKKNMFDKLEGYREINYCEDMDFLLRAIQENFSFYFIGKSLLNYRYRQNSISRKNRLKQLYASRNLQNIAKTGNLKNVSVDYINDLSEKISILEIQKFEKADKEFNDAIVLLKKKKLFSSLVKISRGFFLSKYNRIRIIDVSKFKITEKRVQFFEKNNCKKR